MGQQSIAKGSIRDVAAGGDNALALLNAKVLVLCDRSGSMSQEARAGKTCYELEDDIVTRIQAKYPGQVALAAFADVAYLCPTGSLPPPGGNTNMLDALRVAEPLAAVGLRIIMVTDGEPSHDEAEVLQAAKALRGKMDCIFVGPELSAGAEFCKRLARSVGGSHSEADLTKGPELLEQNLTRLLLASGAR
jgi:hypothetical protein